MFRIGRWAACSVLPLALAAQTSITTGQYDNARSGANLQESTLTPSNVNSANFGKLFSRAVDGYVYAQPLYVPNVAIPGKGTHNVLYVATMHNSVYAFDADDPSAANPLWKNSVLGTPVPHTDLTSLTVNTTGSCTLGGSNPVSALLTRGSTLEPEIGILSTPVIDVVSKTLYAVTASLDNNNYCHKLHALDLATGLEKAGSPVSIDGSVLGTDFFSHTGQITFASAKLLPDSSWSEQIQRSALTLVNGKIYIGFAVYHDPLFTPDPWHGWLFAYDAATLRQVTAFSTTAAGGGGGIWQSGTGPSSDAQGNVYVATGNGDSDGISNFSDSLLKFTPNLSLSAHYSPPNQMQLNDLDWDVGVGGPSVLTGTNFLVSGSKQGLLYLLDKNLSILDTFAATLPCQSLTWDGCSQIRQYAYWGGVTPPLLYIWASPIHQDGPTPEEDVLRAYTIDLSAMKFNRTPASMSTVTSGYPGGMLALSANGTTPGTGIVWAATAMGSAEGQSVPGALRAFDAANVSRELWNSEMNPARDRLGNLAKFALPTVANGKVYVPTFSGQVVTYGTLACTYAITPSATFDFHGGSGVVTVGTTPGCQWSALSNASWIQINLAAAGSGNGTVSFSVAPNSGSGRVGTIAIAGQTFSVSQSAFVTDNPSFITHLYQDLLNRQPDPAGLSYWVGVLNSGTMTRSQVGAFFFTSNEFSSGGLYLIELYEAILGRDPDFGGWIYWSTILRGGAAPEVILNSLLTSPEFVTTYGKLNNSQFVNLVYQNVLGRQPDAGGLAYYIGLLNTGVLTRAKVMDQFVRSSEFQNRIYARAFANLLYMGFLRRTADPAGLAFWTNVLRVPGTLVPAIDGFITSPEYLNRF